MLFYIRRKFPRRRPQSALLTTMCEPYIPFAATGINVTGLVVQLLEERLLDERLVAVADRRLLNGARQQAEQSGRVLWLINFHHYFHWI